MAGLTAMAFFMNYNDYEPDLSGYSTAVMRYLAAIFLRFQTDTNGREVSLSLTMIGCACFYLWLERRKCFAGKIRGSWLLAAIFGFLYVAGIVYLGDVPVFSYKLQTLKLLVGWLGMTLFYHGVLRVLRHVLTLDLSHVSLGKGTLKGWYLKQPFWTVFIFLVLCWIIPLVLKYPAGLCYDVRFQIDQALGNIPLTSHHPILHTLLLGCFVKFGLWIGSANLGIFLFDVVEMVVFALVVSYGSCFLLRIRAAKWAQLGYILFFGLCPFASGYVGTPIKDVYFSIFSLLFTICVAQYVLEEDFFCRWKRPVLLVAAAAGMVLFRNNGSLVVILTVLPLLIALLLRGRKKQGWKLRALTLVLACAIPLGASAALKGIYQPEPGSLVEALSLPLQQTARMATRHGDQVTQEEREIIDQVVDYDSLKDIYDPYISDPVKWTYKNPDTGELLDYFGVWLKQFFREPACYVGSVLQQNVMLGYPGYTNFTYYVGAIDDGYESPYGDLFHTPEWLQEIQSLYEEVLTLLHKLPVFYWINNMAVYVMLLFVLGLFFLCRGDPRNLLYMVPAFAAFLIVLLAPCIILNVRYAFPVIYVIWLYLGCYTSPRSAAKPSALKA